ncbi:MAG TPA: DUF5320 domain-containing protein [Bacteroidia bacterium]|nr:DUF5320 domain-containing protein [Bacteroidia bacterium]
MNKLVTISTVDQNDDKIKEAFRQIQLLNERKTAIQKELKDIEKRIKSILSKEKLMAYDPANNVYLLNVNYRA